MIKNRVIWVSGFLATAVYFLCTTVAYFRYPLAYNPFENWLSDLGNPIINPTGALSYNLGCFITGICLTFFCFGLGFWDDGDKKHRTFLLIAQLTGIISSFALIISALYPLGAQTLTHSISGKIHIFFAGFFLTFSATTLLKHPDQSKWLAYFGLLAALINFIFGAFLHSVFIAEWAAIGFFILYVLMISGNALRPKTPRFETGFRKG